MFKKIFIDLCAQKGVSPSFACTQIGISPAAFSQWSDDTVPRKVTQTKAAEYFGVSVDYLLGKKEKPAAESNELEEDVIIFCRNGQTVKKRLTKDQMAMLAAMVDAVVDDDDNN